MAFILVLCSCANWVKIAEFCEARKKLFRELQNGRPSHDTFGPVFSIINRFHFEKIFAERMHKKFIKAKVK